MEAVLLLLSLSTDCALLTIEPENSSPISFSCFFCSNGDECHKFFVGSFKFACILEGFGLFDPEEVELLASTGVGSTYELNFCYTSFFVRMTIYLIALELQILFHWSMW